MAWLVTWTAQVTQADAQAHPDGDVFTFTGSYADMNGSLGSTDFTAASNAVGAQFLAALTAQYGVDLAQANQ